MKAYDPMQRFIQLYICGLRPTAEPEPARALSVKARQALDKQKQAKPLTVTERAKNVVDFLNDTDE